jgi:hypothetical protein
MQGRTPLAQHDIGLGQHRVFTFRRRIATEVIDVDDLTELRKLAPSPKARRSETMRHCTQAGATCPMI